MVRPTRVQRHIVLLIRKRDPRIPNLVSRHLITHRDNRLRIEAQNELMQLIQY